MNTRDYKPGRIAALDIARGWILVLSLISVSAVINRPYWLENSEWLGIQYVDVIFPLFVTLSGFGMAFAYRNRVSYLATIRRFVVLLVLGVIYNMVTSNTYTWEGLRLAGALQVYAALVLVLALLHLLLQNWKVWAIFTLFLSLAMALYFLWWERHCPTNSLTPACNPSGFFDSFLLGSHMYHQGGLGHDPEGIFGILGAIQTASVGVTAGHLTVSLRISIISSYKNIANPQNKTIEQNQQIVKALCGWAMLVCFWAIGLSLLVPAFKRLWTPPFALIVASGGVILFALAYYIFDAASVTQNSGLKLKFSHAFTALGRNSLLVYFGSHALIGYLLIGGKESIALKLAHTVSFGFDNSLGFMFINLFVWWLLAYVIHRKSIYVHA